MGDVPSCLPGRILGHEGIGIVDKTGSAVTAFKAGELALIVKPAKLSDDFFRAHQPATLTICGSAFVEAGSETTRTCLLLQQPPAALRNGIPGASRRRYLEGPKPNG